MNKFLTTILLLTFSLCVRTYGQILSDLTANAKEATDQLEVIYDLDVFQYFNLYDYDTELKQSVFKKTEEYQTKLAELKSAKAEMLKTTYYTSHTEAFSSDTNYDLKRKGFEIDLGWNLGMGTEGARTPKSINGFLFKALPSKQVPEPLFFGTGVNSEKLFLPMTEEAGLEIENDKKNIDVYFFFTPTGKEKTVFKFLNSDSKWYNITHNDLKADKVRIIVAHKSTGKIYLDKTYTYQPPAPKK